MMLIWTCSKKAARDSGLTVNCLICEGNLATPDEAARKRQIEENTKKLHAAARLGAPVVRMNLGGVGQGENSDTVGVDRVIAAFNEMLPVARQLKIKITIENHGGVSGSADNILRIIQGTDRKWVGSCLDFGNWSNEVRYDSCAKLAPYAYHVHAKAHNFNADGEESQFSFGRILDMLQEAKYRGAISIEWEGGGDPIEGVKRSRDLVRKYWTRL
ncbi:MAG TPA: sugar phosphate isomerase/epimerase family protein [Armatimonadota bacterium]|nr:sugar phosphate isomerase/epimerase family protein [Armatimonadota bacterium]